jgi:toxin FitB
MILLDSSVWIDFFIEGREAQSAAKYLDSLSEVITPAIVLYEVYKKIKRDRSEEEALQAISLMLKTTIVPIEESLALFAADVGLKYSLPMADALVYAIAIEKNVEVVTRDAHFKGLEGVIFV